MIQSFFDPFRSHEDLELAIRRLDIDKLRPLINLMTEGVQSRDDKNIKLLAWLIDFTPRPYEVWKKEQLKTSEDIAPERTATSTDGFGSSGLNDTPSSVLPNSGNRRKIKTSIKNMVMLGMIGGASVFGVYKVSKPMEHQCMYWSGDQYVAKGCQDEILVSATKIALDKQHLKTFRRITKPDTLSYYALSRVWYTKMNNDSLVYFTGPGQHPVHKQKNLRPITKYIIDKYIKRTEAAQL